MPLNLPSSDGGNEFEAWPAEDGRLVSVFILFCFLSVVLFYFVPFLFCCVQSLSLVYWYFGSLKMVFCKEFTMFFFEVDLKLFINGGW